VAWNKVTAPVGAALPPGAWQGDYTLPSRYRFAVGRIVSGNYFTVLGARMSRGRALTWDDDRPGRAPVVVLGNGFWRRHLAADPSVVGRTLILQGTAFTIVGVAAPDFIGAEADAPDFWVPLAARSAIVRGWRERDWREAPDAEVLALLARVRPGVSHERARARISAAARQLASQYPPGRHPVAVTFESAATVLPRTPEASTAAATLLAAVLLVLLIACANVGNILIAQATRRQREIGIRLAIGAGRARLVRQLMTESLVLSTVAGAIGLLLSAATIRFVYPRIVDSLPVPRAVLETLTLDLSPTVRVYLCTFVLASLAGLMLGLLPALHASRASLTDVIKEQGTTLLGRGTRPRFRESLVSGQVALSVVLLVTATLLVRSMRQVQHADPGFASTGVFMVSAGVRSPEPGVSREAELRRRLLDQLSARPDMQAVTFAAKPPLNGPFPSLLLSAAGSSAAAAFNRVGPNYFEAMRLPILRGRPMTDAETRAGASVVLVSERTAQQFWPHANPIGQMVTVDLGAPETLHTQPFVAQVIGVVANARSNLIWQEDRLMVYLPPDPNLTGVLLLRASNVTPRTADALNEAVGASAAAIDRDAAVSVTPLTGSLAIQLAPFQGLAAAGSVLGGVGLGLALVGVYGVMCFAVARRQRELSVRIALGATPRDILRVTVGRGAVSVLTGLLAGYVLASAGAVALRSVLVDLSPFDPAAFAIVGLLVGITGLAAAAVPARRALRSSPISALRAE
jgi:predicted permease